MGSKSSGSNNAFTNQEQESKIMKVLGKDDKHLVVAIQENICI